MQHQIKPRINFEDYPYKVARLSNERNSNVRLPDFKHYFGGQMGGKAAGLAFFQEALLESEKQLHADFGKRVFFTIPKASIM
ncbi:MAG: hypothetical protein N3G22_05095, partial [Candidatus Micrarchaeota archaeon]|nr:hypothetical protein [Candidatus Micrarchaeota archaeon]